METRTSLTQRRKAATELDIALAAARLFADRTSSDVTVEKIAAAAGVSLRTFYRYFPTKHDAIGPLFTVGASAWQEAVAGAAGPDVTAAVRDAIHQVLTPGTPSERERLTWTRNLIRRADGDPALQAVWRKVNAESETRLCAIIADRLPARADRLTTRLLAAAATDAIRVSLEHWAIDTRGAVDRLAGLATEAFEQLSAGIAR